MLEHLRARAAAILIAVAVTWGALLAIDAWACTLPGWGRFESVRPAICRVGDAAIVPFAPLAAALIPASAHHFGRLHMVLRTAMAAVFFVGAVALFRAGRHGREARRRAKGEGGGAGPTRRQALSRLSDAAVLGTGAALGGWAIVVEPSRLRVARYEVHVEGLPPGLDGFRIVQLSDTHFGPYTGQGQIRDAVELANGLEPDLVALTGDFVHRGTQMIAPGIRPFAGLRSRLGVVSVLGNHDHWEDAGACLAALRRAGARSIDNSRVFVTASGLADSDSPGGSLAICGVGDLWEDVCSARSALRGVPAACPRVLLSHNPDVAEEFLVTYPDERFDLQLSGHTHGGQVSLPFVGAPIVPSRYGAKYAGGLVAGPRWPVIVSRGVGISVAPLRLGVVPEVVVVLLRRAGGE
jgi:hypothetical protein